MIKKTLKKFTVCVFLFLKITCYFTNAHESLEKFNCSDFHSEEFKQYKRITDLYNMCWNGAKPDILNDHDFFNLDNIDTYENFYRKKRDGISTDEEMTYKKVMIDAILPQLYFEKEDGSYYPTKNLEYIRSFLLGTEHIEKEKKQTIILSFVATFERFLFIKKSVFFAKFLEQNAPHLNYTKIKKAIKNLVSADIAPNDSNLHKDMKALASSPCMSMFIHVGGFPDSVFDAIVMSAYKNIDSFYKTVTQYRFREYVLSTCFSDAFFDLLEKKAYFSFILPYALQETMALSRSLGQFNDTNVQKSTSYITFQDLKTGKYVEKKIRKLTTPEKEKLKIELLQRLRIEKKYFSQITDSMLYYVGFEKEGTVFFSEQKKSLEREALSVLSAFPGEIERIFLQTYYLLKKKNLIHTLSNGTEKITEWMRIKSFKENIIQNQIKSLANEFYKKDEFLLNILNETLDIETLKKIYAAFNKIDSYILAEMAKKYLYRYLLIDQYYPGIIKKQKERLIFDLTQKIENQKHVAIERDKLIQELIDEEEKKTKKKKPVKKQKAQKKKIKMKGTKEEIKSSFIKIEKKEEPQKLNASKKMPPQKKKSVHPLKKPGNQNKPVKKNQNQALKPSSIQKPETFTEKENYESNIIIISKEDKSEENSFPQDVQKLQLELENWEEKNIQLQKNINLKEEQCHQLKKETTLIRKEIDQIRSYLRYIQKLKQENRNKFKNDLKNIDLSLKEENATEVANENISYLVDLSNQILDYSYYDFYQGVALMNSLLVDKIRLIDEINFLFMENNQLLLEIENRKKFISNNNNNVKKEKTGFFSKITEKKKEVTEIVKGVSSFIKHKDVRKLPPHLHSNFEFLLSKNSQVKTLNHRLYKQLEYVDRKLPNLEKQNREVKAEMFHIQQKYAEIMNHFHRDAYQHQIKIQDFYENTLLKKIPSSQKRHDFSSSIKYFHSVNQDVTLKMGHLTLDINNLTAELSSLTYQKNFLFFDNTRFKSQLLEDKKE